MLSMRKIMTTGSKMRQVQFCIFTTAGYIHYKGQLVKKVSV